MRRTILEFWLNCSFYVGPVQLLIPNSIRSDRSLVLRNYGFKIWELDPQQLPQSQSVILINHQKVHHPDKMGPAPKKPLYAGSSHRLLAELVVGVDFVVQIWLGNALGSL